MMTRRLGLGLLAAIATSLTAMPVAAETPDLPEWMSVDHDAKVVTMTVVAGLDASNNSWNFNGFAHGAATIVVPAGYQVRLTFENQDAMGMVHSVGVGQKSETTNAVFTSPTPAFAGAISPNAEDPVNATKVGESAVLDFVADTAGDYALICYSPGHSVAGMWINFRVAGDGSVGFEAP
ncbi:MAG: sulfocyanin-like copper-binding protein [Gemmatimonadota bacterium]|nr:sulfocyanin-like copper-binding protein [Gemmatimonadota bacterium]